MSRNSGSIYIPSESLYYALFPLADRRIKKGSLEARMTALAQFIDCLILADEVVTDRGNYKIDRDLAELIQQCELDDKLGYLEVGNIDEIPLSAAMHLAPSAFSILPGVSEMIRESKIGDLPLEELTRQFLDDFEAAWHNKMFPVSQGEENNIVDFLGSVFPYMAEELTAEQQHFLDAIEELFMNDGLPPDTNEKMRSIFSWIFRGITEASLNTALGYGMAYYPYSLQSTVILSRPVFAPSSNVFMDKLTDAKYERLAELNDFLYTKHSRIVHLPILFDYVLSKADSPAQIIKIALDVRERKDVRKYRGWCKKLDEALAQGQQEEAIKLIEAVKSYIDEISGRIKESPPKISVQVSFPPAIIFDVPSLDLTRKGHLVFLEKIYRGTRSPLVRGQKVAKLFKLDL